MFVRNKVTNKQSEQLGTIGVHIQINYLVKCVANIIDSHNKGRFLNDIVATDTYINMKYKTTFTFYYKINLTLLY